eukprot:CAMPEP_0118957582 /NCGR_PEP_ID=MMETSP1169-20130426/62180_1 /TAXON_ID=36882 /ORGANISM="Pyramimonas obovata, Strain CCMP722" /LENGTH=424 /DNA_ID=CAMNT_0006905671 /DNA_START=995 /DNA_END=2267 /DNA_ORIENTATION=+
MNVLTQIKNQQKIAAQELERGVKDSASWHDAFKDSAYVYCGGIPYDLTEGDLITVFAQYGEIVDCNLVRDQDTGKSRGFAYLAYEDQRSTNVAVDNLNGARLVGRTLKVDHVKDYRMKKEELDADAAEAKGSAAWGNDGYEENQGRPSGARPEASQAKAGADGAKQPWEIGGSAFDFLLRQQSASTMGKGGGGGLAFLNKKSWHTGGFKQIEEVWKREAQAENEKKKIEELTKQIDEERKQEEMMGVASSAGIVQRTERLEFMYRGVMATKQPEVVQTGDDTMNQPFQMKEDDKKLKKMETKQAPGALFLDDTPKSMNEQWARLNNDPMLMIKQMEMERLKHVKNNPVKMAQIKKEVEELRAKKKAKKEAKKEAKKAKKEAKKAKKEGKKDKKANSSDSDSSPSPPRTRPSAAAYFEEQPAQPL